MWNQTSFIPSAGQQNGLPVKFNSKTKSEPQNQVLHSASQDSFTPKSQATSVHFGTRRPSPDPIFAVTGRGYSQIADLYPDSVMQSLHPDDDILDVGAGRGQFVQDLYNGGYRKAVGFDKAVETDLVGKIDIREADKSFFANQFNHIFSTWSIFTYDVDKHFQQESLEKMGHWLKPGGRIYLSPVDVNRIFELAYDIPNLTISDYGTKGSHRDPHTGKKTGNNYVILTRI